MEKSPVTFDQVSIESNNLEKRFSLWSTVALQVSLICSPIALGTFLSTVVGVGGSPVLLYGFILAVTCDLIICYSMAELASAFPHSSAQVHWTYCLAPESYRRVLSFVVGVLACAGWIFAIFATAYTNSMFILSMVEMYHPDFVPADWHYYVLYAAFVVLAVLFNVFAVGLLPAFTYFSAAVINIGTLFIIITLLVRTPTKQTTDFVWKTITNETGWSSNGVVFFIGLLPSIAAVTMFDGPAHQTDEIPNPSRNVPLVMTIANSFSAIFAFVSAIVYMYCVTNVENLGAPIGGEPIIQLMLDSFNSKALTTIGIMFLIMTFSFSLVGYVCSTSRLFWSFANSNGFPLGQSVFGKVHHTLKAPVNAILLVGFITIVLGCMIFGSTTALAAVLGSCMVCANMSYIVPILMLLIRSKFALSPEKRFPSDGTKTSGVPYFTLGKLGLPLNIAAVSWACFIMVWLNFPSYAPVSSSNMNYACAVLGVTFVLSVIVWFTYARVHYCYTGHGHSI